MCGLFGFAGPGRGDMTMLAQLASLAGRRGPDAWGMWADGRLHLGMGRIPADAVSCLPAPSVLLGHCRLSTVLGTKVLGACQPIRVGDFVVAHNGTVENVEDLELEFGFSLATGVDSEAIAHLLGRHAPHLGPVMARVRHGGGFAVAALCLRTGKVELLAHGLPLWRRDVPEGVYWCSVRPGPGWEAVHA